MADPVCDNGKYFTKNGIPWITPADMSKNTECKFISKGETDVTEEGKDSASLKIFPANTTLMTSRIEKAKSD